MSSVITLSAVDRKAAANVEKLLSSSDFHHVQLGLELLLALSSPAIAQSLIEGVEVDGHGRVVMSEEASQRSYFRRDGHRDLVAVSLLNSAGLLSEVTAIHMQNATVRNIDFLAPLTHLNTLKLSAFRRLERIDAIAQMVHLETLALDMSAIKNVGALSGLSRLQKLSLQGCKQLGDLSGLKQLSALKTLDLLGCLRLQKIDTLGALTQLESLNLSRCHSLKTVDGLAGLTQLKVLNLRYCRGIKNLDGIAELTALERLDIRRCPFLKNRSGLHALKVQNPGVIVDG